MSLFVQAQVVPPFRANAYVVGDLEAREALIVDPGGEIDALAHIAARTQLKLVALVATHAHIDHVGGAADAQRRFGVPLWMHAADRRWLEALDQQAAMFGLPRVQIPTVERWLEDGDAVGVGGRRGRAIHTPGHTPGGLCLFFPDDAALFTGDTLFVNSVGRTDLPGGSAQQLVASIRERLYPLGDEVTLYPGHGPPGRLGDERVGNPFVAEETP
jgi:hydroxyacylglutathione hydrolase